MLTHKLENGVELRQVSRRYAEELNALVLENLEHLSVWLAWAVEDYGIENTQEFIDRKLKQIAKETEIPLLIFDEGQIIGTISLFEIDKVNRNAEIGYWIAENAQGKGTATIASKAVIEYAFEELNLNRIVIRCATENVKSQAIPKRLGFTKEGISRQVAWLNDRFVGLINFSILKEEWERRSTFED